MENEPLSKGINKNVLVICITVVLVCLMISGTIVFGNFGSQSGNKVAVQPQVAGSKEVSVDNDALLGNGNAPVTMIEFSDYECPFCKRHFTDVYPQIKKDYVDTGKVKLVFRDYIAVPGHNPLATSEAMAAQCARDQGGDFAYFQYHDELFKKTTSNGNGLALSELPAIAKSLGLDAVQFTQCLDSNKYKDEIGKDIADGALAGVSGTPTFFVGKSSQNGIIDGTIIVGAQPYAVFKAAIDQALGGK